MIAKNKKSEGGKFNWWVLFLKIEKQMKQKMAHTIILSLFYAVKLSQQIRKQLLRERVDNFIFLNFNSI